MPRNRPSYIPSAAFADDLSPSEFKLLAWLYFRHKPRGECRASYRDICSGTGLSEKTVYHGLNALEGKRWFVVRQRRHRHSTVIVLQVPPQYTGDSVNSTSHLQSDDPPESYSSDSANDAPPDSVDFTSPKEGVQSYPNLIPFRKVRYGS